MKIKSIFILLFLSFALSLTACVSTSTTSSEPAVAAYTAENTALPEGSTVDLHLFATSKDADRWLIQNRPSNWAPKHTPAPDEYLLASVDVDGWFKQAYTPEEIGPIGSLMVEKQLPVGVSEYACNDGRRHIFVVANSDYSQFLITRQDYIPYEVPEK